LFGPRWLKAIQYGIGERLAIDRVVCPSLNAFRAELGLAPIRRITRWWHSPRQTIGLFPEWFAPPQADWPANTSLTDFPLWDERQGEHWPDDVERFLAAGEPPLAFTPGSANVFGANFFRAAAEASRQLNRRAILLTRFAEQLPAELPERVVHFPYVPFSQLLPRAAATIHHGGVGSTAQGFAAATPQLLMPLAHDQFDNAERVRRLGVGDSLPAKAFTAERLAKKLSGILASDSVARACREVASRLKNRDGAARAAEMIERQASK
jgi:UDP:flavonoid glycosyltransferase YjiC (YdhE family)